MKWLLTRKARQVEHREIKLRLDTVEEKQGEQERRLENLQKEVEVIKRPWNQPSST